MILRLKNNHLNGGDGSDINKIKIKRQNDKSFLLTIYDGTGLDKNDQLITGVLTQEEAEVIADAILGWKK